MANETLARRYASAVFALASEEGAAERVGADLSTIASAIDSDPQIRGFYVAPVVNRGDKASALTATFGGKVDNIALHTVLLLVRKRRETLLNDLVAQYRVLEQGARGAESLTITSARELPADETRSIVERLEKIYKKKFDLTIKHEPDLIGGVRVTMGDRRIDGSVSGRLEELSRTLFAQN